MKISEELIDRIKEHEGFKEYSYNDQLGIPTIGYGFKISELTLTKEISSLILRKKLGEIISSLPLYINWFAYTSISIQEVLIEMAYQMGIQGLLNFKKTLSYLEDEEYKKAAKEMLDSKWYKQTPNRAIRLSNIVAKCEEDL